VKSIVEEYLDRCDRGLPDYGKIVLIMVKTVTQSDWKFNVNLCEVNKLNFCVVKRVGTFSTNVGVHLFQ